MQKLIMLAGALFLAGCATQPYPAASVAPYDQRAFNALAYSQAWQTPPMQIAPTIPYQMPNTCVAYCW